MPTDDLLAPVDYLVVAFPDGLPHPEGFELLLELVDRGTIRVLDVEFVIADGDGPRRIPATDLPAVDGFDAELWAGASSDLLDDEDLAEIGNELGAGELAAVVLVEQEWLHGVAAAWAASGATLVADGGVPTDDLLDALDAAENR